MAIGDLGSVQDTFEFDTSRGFYPRICHVSGYIYAITYETDDYHGKILTVEITAAGQITEPAVDTWEYNEVGSARNWPGIYKGPGHVFLMATLNGGNATLYSFHIASNGTITKSFDGTLQLEATGSQYFELTHIGGVCYSVSYMRDDGQGWMTTFSCDSSGTLAELDSKYISDPYSFSGNSITKIYPNYFALCFYVGTSGFIAVLNITDLGIITVEDLQAYQDAVGGHIGMSPCQTVAPGIVAVAFGGAGNLGKILTIAINAAGTVTDLEVDIYEFDSTYAFVQDMISFGKNYFAVLYRNTDYAGIIKTFHIDDSGTITDPYCDSHQMIPDPSEASFLSDFRRDCFVAVNQGLMDDGWLFTLDVIAPEAVRPHNELVLGIGP